MHLYLTESNIKVGLSSGKLSVKDVRDGSIVRELPFLDIEGISVFGRPQLSTQLLRGCIEKSIPVLYYSEDGHYFGHLTSSERIDPERQKKQIYTTDNDAFCLEWSKRIVAAKIQSSIGLLTSNADIFEFEMGELKGLYHSLRYLQEAQEVSTVLGYEATLLKPILRVYLNSYVARIFLLQKGARDLQETPLIQCSVMVIALSTEI